MNISPRHILPVLVAVVAACAISSCSSRKAAVASGRTDREITLDRWLEATLGADTMRRPDNLEADRVIEQAQQWIGTRYLYGGTTRQGVDCSALIMNVYRDGCGLKLPRTAASQHQYSARVDRKDLLPGDLVFFTSRRKGNGVAHVGLYIGNGRIIHASTSRGVIRSSLSEKYYADHYHSAGRILKPGKTRVEPVAEVKALTPEILRADSIAEAQRELLDMMLEAAIDSIYSSDPF